MQRELESYLDGPILEAEKRAKGVEERARGVAKLLERIDKLEETIDNPTQ